MGKINIDTNQLSSAIQILEEKTQEMYEIFSNIESETKKVPQFWQGKVSEGNIGRFNEFIKNFEPTKEKCAQYISFLKDVAKKYSDLDENLKKSFDA